VNRTASPEANDVVVAEALPSNARLSHGAQEKPHMNIDFLNTFGKGEFQIINLSPGIMSPGIFK